MFFGKCQYSELLVALDIICSSRQRYPAPRFRHIHPFSRTLLPSSTWRLVTSHRSKEMILQLCPEFVGPGKARGEC